MITAIFWVVVHLILINGEKYDCDSDIFCHGEILHKIQTLNIFSGSENFFNKKLKNSPEMIKNNFQIINKNLVSDVHNFALQNFEDDELLVCTTFQTREMPNLQNSVTNLEYQKFVSKISEMWSKLAVKTSEQQNPEYHALVYLPNCFIKADEFTPTMNYYDSYWIIRGLLANGLTHMAAGILRNYADLINNFGYVLHSNRVYSSRRTQLPLLGLMVEAYFELTKDDDFVYEILEPMDQEFQWWMKNRYTEVNVENKIHRMFHYDSQVRSTPRPEEYNTDYQLAEKIENKDKKEDLYSALHALDESGFASFSRFIRNNHRVKEAEGEKSWLNLDVSSLIPVELNCVMEKYALLLGTWNEEYNGTDKGYKKISAALRNSIDTVLWSKKEKVWFDWDITMNMHRKIFSLTNLMPLFTTSYEKNNSEYSKGVLEYLKRNNIIDSDNSPQYFIIPTSLEKSGRKWDFEFGSPSLNLFVIEGLGLINDKTSKKLALEFSKLLVKTCYESYIRHGTLFKQYSAIQLRSSWHEASSGDSKISTAGYASTNGALLSLFKRFGNSLKSSDYFNFESSVIDPNAEKDIPNKPTEIQKRHETHKY